MQFHPTAKKENERMSCIVSRREEKLPLPLKPEQKHDDDKDETDMMTMRVKTRKTLASTPSFPLPTLPCFPDKGGRVVIVLKTKGSYSRSHIYTHAKHTHVSNMHTYITDKRSPKKALKPRSSSPPTTTRFYTMLFEMTSCMSKWCMWVFKP